VTHTIADAEAAIARHPTDLTQLSMAADLMQELDDPRGADFAACLGGDLSAEELMRRHPADVSAMYVAAWAMAGRGGCSRCKGDGWVYAGYDGGREECPLCEGTGNGHEGRLRAEALRLLAECGKVGRQSDEGPRYFCHDVPAEEKVYAGWWSKAADIALKTLFRVGRCHLLDAYAAADPDTRRQWADETRALTPKEVVV
jgi:hypothetical protein